jgi:hypothetical protein
MVTAIRQMESSLDDSRPRRGDYAGEEDDDLKITYPLTRCLQILKEKHIQISRLHRERFEQVKSELSRTAQATWNANWRRACSGPRVIFAAPRADIRQAGTSSHGAEPVNTHDLRPVTLVC